MLIRCRKCLRMPFGMAYLQLRSIHVKVITFAFSILLVQFILNKNCLKDRVWACVCLEGLTKEEKWEKSLSQVVNNHTWSELTQLNYNSSSNITFFFSITLFPLKILIAIIDIRISHTQKINCYISLYKKKQLLWKEHYKFHSIKCVYI